MIVVPKIRDKVPVEVRQRVRDATRAVFIWTNFFSELLNVSVNYTDLAEYALLIPRADDIVDREMREITENDLQKSQIIKEMLRKAKSPKFPQVLLEAVKAQSRSINQITNQYLSKEELEEITFHKGGMSMLAALHFITNPTADEEELFYKIGAILQVFDDFQDQDIDYKEGVSTLFTRGYYTIKDVNRLLREYERILLNKYGLKALKLILFTRFSIILAKFYNFRQELIHLFKNPS